MSSKRKQSMPKNYFSNIKYDKHTTWDKNKNYVSFNIKNTRVSLVNSIRRTIISDVESIGIRTLPYDKSQVSVNSNDTPLYDQFVAERLSNVPIHMPDVDNINLSDYELTLDVKNDSNLPKDIFSNDIKIRKLSKMNYMSDSDTKKIFPPDPITGEYVFINVLKPKYYQYTEASKDVDYTKNSQQLLSAGAANSHISVSKKELSLSMTAGICKSNGAENGKFNPTCLAIHTFVVDDAKAEKALQEYLAEHLGKSDKTKEQLVRRFNTNQRSRYYMTDHNGDANMFKFEVESIGVIPPLVIFYRAMNYLNNRIRNFQKNLDLVTNKDNYVENDKIEVIPSRDKINGWEIIVQGEDDTLANVLVDYLNILFCSPNSDPSLESVGYPRPHPQRKLVKIIVQPKEHEKFSDVAKTYIKPTCKYVIDLIDSMRKEMEKSPELIDEIKRVQSAPK